MIILAGILVLGAALFFKTDVEEIIESKSDNWTKYDGLFRQWGTAYGVPWTWLKAIALNESSLGRAPSVARGLEFPKDVEGSKSSDGKSWGLMQVTLATAKGLDPSATPEKLNDPNFSVRLAAQYISQLQNMFSKLDLRFSEYVIKSYNQGPGNTRKEISGATSGYAQEYWDRFERNLERVVNV